MPPLSRVRPSFPFSGARPVCSCRAGHLNRAPIMALWSHNRLKNWIIWIATSRKPWDDDDNKLEESAMEPNLLLEEDLSRSKV
ncbi:hypothetical protein BHM03_00041382 [Ensete ventricosum]|nr:hypothetical protein BHM03_00041382 [Ensete ventricosum]